MLRIRAETQANSSCGLNYCSCSTSDSAIRSFENRKFFFGIIKITLENEGQCPEITAGDMQNTKKVKEMCQGSVTLSYTA